MSERRAHRALIVLAALVFLCGCSSDDDGGGSGAPSGVVSMAGTWRGTSDFQQVETHHISDISMTVRQNDRIVDGTVSFTSAGWSGWSATFTGQLSGNSSESQFFGNITFSATPQSGGGTCTGVVQVGGVTRTNSLRWDGPTGRIGPTGNSGGSTVFVGDIYGISCGFSVGKT